MIELKNISKIYRDNDREVRALDNVSLSVKAGEFIVVRGASGSGKTTLLLTLGAMLKPTSGYLSIDNEEIYSLSEGERNSFRALKIGFVFQMFHLLPYLNILENVIIASVKKGREEAMDLLAGFGLGDRLTHKPYALSAGEKQRTAVARALINDPKILLADEPTGNLDPVNAEEIMKSFSEFHKKGGTVLLVTHGTEADKYADRIIQLEKGKIVEEVRK